MTVIDWNRYRKCPVCSAETGEHCLTRSGYGTLRDGVPHNADVAAEKPHSTRELRAGYARTGGAR